MINTISVKDKLVEVPHIISESMDGEMVVVEHVHHSIYNFVRKRTLFAVFGSGICSIPYIYRTMCGVND